jgi:hypothetical protein
MRNGPTIMHTYEVSYSFRSLQYPEVEMLATKVVKAHAKRLQNSIHVAITFGDYLSTNTQTYSREDLVSLRDMFTEVLEDWH